MWLGSRRTFLTSLLYGTARARRLLVAPNTGCSSVSMSGIHTGRLPPYIPPNLDAAQQKLYDNIVETRIKVVGEKALFDEAGGLRGPWNPEVASPALGQHLERLATAVRTENSLEARLYEIAILVVGVHWKAQFEWYAHERIARKAGVAEAAFPIIKAGLPAHQLEGILKPDEIAVYKLAVELMDTKRVSAATYADTKQALGGDDKKLVDLCLTMGCYSAVSKLLNMFEVSIPTGEHLPFDEPSAS